ncbi:MAG: response regulator [SAR324 cluster bacterium]|nr:response regulator [SAR324 cluster bacterium]
MEHDQHNKKKVILVDDDREFIAMFSMGLAEQYDIRAFSSGQECLELLMTRKFIPDIFFLDVHLEWGHGFDLSKKIKQMPAFQKIPVVFISGDSESYEEAFNLGAFTFLPKPFDLASLTGIIEEAGQTDIVVDES